MLLILITIIALFAIYISVNNDPSENPSPKDLDANARSARLEREGKPEAPNKTLNLTAEEAQDLAIQQAAVRAKREKRKENELSWEEEVARIKKNTQELTNRALTMKAELLDQEREKILNSIKEVSYTVKTPAQVIQLGRSQLAKVSDHQTPEVDFAEIQKNNAEKVAKRNEERKKGNKDVIRSYRLKH